LFIARFSLYYKQNAQDEPVPLATFARTTKVQQLYLIHPFGCLNYIIDPAPTAKK